MNFTKMHGCANDYIYLNCLDGQPQNVPELAKRLSDRHTGVGGDGIVLICRSDAADFRMRMFNADGSEGAMCGNAIRCVGKYVYDRGLTGKTELDVETKSGVKHLSLTVKDGAVCSATVDMGAPRDVKLRQTLTALGKEYSYNYVSMGNPHCVIFTNGVEGMRIDETGSAIENDAALFPDRVNVEFCELCGDNTLRVRVWERGSGETMACGTGACAAAVAATETGVCERGKPVFVRMNGGTLKIEYGETVYMTGPAEFSFDGTI